MKADKLNDFQGALADFDRVISLLEYERGNKYTLSKTYHHRGNLKADKLEDFQGALSDFNQAIIIDSEFTDTYQSRGKLKYAKLNDRPGGIADLRQAINLAISQNNTQVLSNAQKMLQSWGVK